MKRRKTTVQAWPEGVIARYLTLAGTTVDITGRDAYCKPKCLGCLETGPSLRLEHVREWAQDHAEFCRALPNPHRPEPPS